MLGNNGIYQATIRVPKNRIGNGLRKNLGKSREKLEQKCKKDADLIKLPGLAWALAKVSVMTY